MTETPQTTRCRVRINVTGQGQHQCEEPAVEGGYCAKHQSAFSRHLIPLVPARAGEPTVRDDLLAAAKLFRGVEDGKLLATGLHLFADRLEAHARALAPATAPTMNDPAIYKLVEAAVLKRDDELLEAAKVDLARADDFDAENLALALEMCRKFAPSAFHAALNVAAKRVRAPATAEPTAEVREVAARFLDGISNAGDAACVLHDFKGKSGVCVPAADLRHALDALLSRGSGPVGQASEALRKALLNVPPDAVLTAYWHPSASMGNVRKDLEGVTAADLWMLAAPVAASAEAKRIEITDAMVERGTDALWSIGMHERPNRDLAKHAVREILRAAHASPESGV